MRVFFFFAREQKNRSHDIRGERSGRRGETPFPISRIRQCIPPLLSFSPLQSLRGDDFPLLPPSFSISREKNGKEIQVQGSPPAGVTGRNCSDHPFLRMDPFFSSLPLGMGANCPVFLLLLQGLRRLCGRDRKKGLISQIFERIIPSDDRVFLYAWAKGKFGRLFPESSPLCFSAPKTFRGLLRGKLQCAFVVLYSVAGQWVSL